MKQNQFAAASTEALVIEFEALCLAQFRAGERDETADYNRRYRVVEALINELKSRAGDERRRLVQYFDHPNPEARLIAAHAMLALDPAGARTVLETLRGSFYAQAISAGATLRALSTGEYVPDRPTP